MVVRSVCYILRHHRRAGESRGKLFIYCHQLVNLRHALPHPPPLHRMTYGMITGDLLFGAHGVFIFLIEEFIPEQVVADFPVFVSSAQLYVKNERSRGWVSACQHFRRFY